MKRLIVLAACLSLVLLLAACGPGGPQPVSLNFTGTDSFEFNPRTATAQTGSEVTVTLDNTGILEHSWTLVGQGVDPLTATEADVLGSAGSGVVPGGGNSTFTFTAPAPGAYIYVCTVPGHAAGGMVGTLTVTD